MTSLSISEAKTHLPELIRKIDRKFETFVITKNGSPKAVLMSCDELEGLLETIEILKDKVLTSSLRRSRGESKRGKTIPFKKVKK